MKLKCIFVLLGLLLHTSSAEALGPNKPVIPSGTLQSARAKKLLLATVHVEPNEFEWKGVPVSFKQAWVQRTKNENQILLCFTIQGVKKRSNPFHGFDSDDLLFGASAHNKYFGLYANWFDGHWVHAMNITAESAQRLPKAIDVEFYGSAPVRPKNAPVINRFVFEINEAVSTKQ